EIMQAFVPLNCLKRSLVERKTENNHLLTEHVTKFSAHRFVAHNVSCRNMTVMCPEHNLCVGVVVQDPLDVVGHAAVARNFVGSHLNGLDHYPRVLHDPLQLAISNSTFGIHLS